MTASLLATQLRNLAERVDELDPAVIPAVLGELERLRAILWCRLQAPSTSAMSAPTPAPMLNIADAAHVLGISRSGLRRLTAKGEVPVVDVGHRRLYRREALDRFLVTRERNGG